MPGKHPPILSYGFRSRCPLRKGSVKAPTAPPSGSSSRPIPRGRQSGAGGARERPEPGLLQSVSEVRQAIIPPILDEPQKRRTGAGLR